jgi:hypothetical protein
MSEERVNRPDEIPRDQWPKNLSEWRNNKNKKIYKFVTVVRHSETLEQMALYYQDDTGRVDLSDNWVRPLKMFLEKFTPLEQK